jgi:feruloyl esterase
METPMIRLTPPSPPPHRTARRTLALLTSGVLAGTALTACGGGDGTDRDTALLTCDDSLKTAFKPDAQTTVTAVKSFKQGDALLLSGTASSSTATATADVCLVKLNVGPGNPGPDGAPSTSAGIGIEVWLPAKAAWNGRVHALGGGGWQGGVAGSASAIASTAAAAVAGNEGAVSSVTDTGHSVPGTGAFAMNPDGTINETLWTDFAVRGIHEQAVKTKAVARAFYGRAPTRSYWEGGSTGGRQGLKLAQRHPEDFDGIIALYPAIHWTRFITSELYPQIVFQRDLGGVPLTRAQSDLASNAAIAACDDVAGQDLGFILDPGRCRYDPSTDANVLCPSDGGSSTSAACLTRTQARAVNKIWYGMTRDGSVPDAASDIGWDAATSTTLMGSGTQRWFGLARGTSLYSPFFVGLADPDRAFPIAPDLVALALQNPTLADSGFLNASGNGASAWKQLSYGQLSEAYDRGLALQTRFADVNAEDADLSAFRARGGKLLTWHGLADELIAPQGTMHYYHRVAAQAGGMAAAQDFYRLYLVPGAGHGTPNGTSNPAAVVPNFAAGQFYGMLTAWVEQGSAPGTVTLQAGSGGTARSLPTCVYPQRVAHVSGDAALATSYRCN